MFFSEYIHISKTPENFTSVKIKNKRSGLVVRKPNIHQLAEEANMWNILKRQGNEPLRMLCMFPKPFLPTLQDIVNPKKSSTSSCQCKYK